MLFRNPEEILESSLWNDDSKTWKLPSAIENTVKLPPANLRSDFLKAVSIEHKDSEANVEGDKEISSTDSEDNNVSILLNFNYNFNRNTFEN